MKKTQAVIRHHQGYDEEWSDEVHGRVRWKTLFTSDKTSTDSMVAGVAEISPGDVFQPHCHHPPEIYHIVEGSGTITIEGESEEMRMGSTAFIPGNAVHSIRNDGEQMLRFFYVFGEDSMENITYKFVKSEAVSESME